MAALWKQNWRETKQHFIDWWDREGLVVGKWGGVSVSRPNAQADDPGAATLERGYTDAVYRARKTRFSLSRNAFPLDIPPLAMTDIGPGSLGTFLGSEPAFSEDTVWYKPCIVEPESHPPLAFDPDAKWWRIHESVLRENVKASRGNYLVACPDLIENIDTLSQMRDPQALMVDMVERPDWVKQKVAEINEVFFAAYKRIFGIIKFDDGEDVGAAYGAYYLWGPGRTAKVQCDASAMFSPKMFEEFVLPSLRAQCQWLDYSMYHLDGTQCVCHLEHILSIKELDAIEWTPQAGIPNGGSPQWYDLYKQIKAAGKSVQAVNVELDEVAPLLDAIGPKGTYVMAKIANMREAEELAKRVEPYR